LNVGGEVMTWWATWRRTDGWLQNWNRMIENIVCLFIQAAWSCLLMLWLLTVLYYFVLFCSRMTLNCIHIFIVTGSFLYWCVTRPASQRFFIIHSCIYLRILIISYLATFLSTNSLSVLMCRKAVNQSIKFCSRLRKFVYFNWLYCFVGWALDGTVMK